jgi:hypothetical protein
MTWMDPTLEPPEATVSPESPPSLRQQILEQEDEKKIAKVGDLQVMGLVLKSIGGQLEGLIEQFNTVQVLYQKMVEANVPKPPTVETMGQNGDID